MNPPRLLVHTSPQTVRWADMDALGHVNNINYFRYFEQARIEWIYAYMLAQGGRAYDGGEGPVIVNASCDFLVPLVYPADIVVTMFLGDPGRTSVGSFYELHSAGKKFAQGAAKMVWIDIASGRPVPLPAPLLAPLRDLAG
ncbi:MAG: thioesterase family protein [Betaproteobacteria bacterium]